MLAQKIRSLTPVADISQVLGEVEALLNDSIATEPYRIPVTAEPEQLVDLSKIDFDALQKRFEQGRKRTEAEKLESEIEKQLDHMLKENRTRVDFLKKFQELIEDYNAGSKNIEAFFAELVEFAQTLNEDRSGVLPKD